MIDPRVVLIILAIAGAVYGVQWLGRQVKVGTHKVGCGIAKMVGHPCAPYTPPPPPVFYPGEIEVQ